MVTARQRQAAAGGDVDESQVPTEIQISFLMFLSFCFSLLSPFFFLLDLGRLMGTEGVGFPWDANSY